MRMMSRAAATVMVLLASACVAVISPSTSTAAAPSPAAARVVTLVTGERVQLSTDAGGRTSATVLDVPGVAPSATRQVQVLSAAGHTYVVPREAAGLLGRQLDPSLFDVDAVGGPLQVDVSWADGARPRAIAGVTDGRVTDPAAFGAALRLGALPASVRLRSAAAGPVITPNYVMSTLQVRGIDALGKKASFGTVYVVNMDDTARFTSLQSFYDGSVSFSVPLGTYNIAIAITTSTASGAYVSDTLIVRPQIEVTGSRTVVVADARDATVHVPVPKTSRPSSYYMFQAWVGRTTRAGNRMEYTDQLVLGDLNFYVEPTPPATVGTMRWFDYFRLVSPASAASPYEYDLGNVATGAVPRRFPSSVRDDDLAHLHATYRSDTTGRSSYYYRNAWQPQQTIDLNAVTPLTAPATQDEYVSGLPDVRWNQNLVVKADEYNPIVTETPTIYAPGQQANVTWLGAVTHPAPVDPPDTVQRCVACRQGDRFTFAVDPWTDAQGHFVQQYYSGGTLTATTGYRLSRDGTVLAAGASTAATVTLAPTTATYQLAVDTTKTAPWWAIDSASHTVWTWTSAPRAGTLPAQRTCRDGTQSCAFEPLIYVDQVAAADRYNSVPPGTVATIDLYAHHQRYDTTSPGIAGVTLSYSVDGGSTWTSADVAALGHDRYRARIAVPSGASGYLATRVVATDTAGNQVDDTTTDAVHVGAPPSDPGGPGSGSGGGAPSPGVRPACAPAVAPRAACLAEVATTADSPAAAPSGYGPADLQDAYALPSAAAGTGQTVAIVDAYDDPNAEADLATYRSQYGLPPCTTTNGCLGKIDQNGGTSYPTPDVGWALEISLDLDMVSAACPNCHILLVEANSNDLSDLGAAVNTAVRAGAGIISNSYATNEFPAERQFETFYRHPGHAIVASSGDFGYGTMYPAASRYVTAVGGTTLVRAANGRGWDESVWHGAGSGCSAYVPKPSWQHDRNCPMRMVSDVSAVADPATGVAVYDTLGYDGWQVVGGTSVSAPLIAATYALAGRTRTFDPSYLYRHRRPDQLNDVTRGTNVPGQTASTCGGDYLCTGVPGYDGPTGLGTPRTAAAF